MILGMVFVVGLEDIVVLEMLEIVIMVFVPLFAEGLVDVVLAEGELLAMLVLTFDLLLGPMLIVVVARCVCVECVVPLLGF